MTFGERENETSIELDLNVEFGIRENKRKKFKWKKKIQNVRIYSLRLAEWL